MEQTEKERDLEAWEEHVVEALLFAMGDSVGIAQIANAIEGDAQRAEHAAERLKKRYERYPGGIRILKLENRYQMVTAKEYFDSLIRVVTHPKKPVLTEILLETLAIVAYRQPVTKSEIEKIRGVKCEHAINKLIEYDMIYEAGRLDTIGRPAVFKTTETFLRRFGISSSDELPILRPETEAEIKEAVEEEVGEEKQEERKGETAL